MNATISERAIAAQNTPSFLARPRWTKFLWALLKPVKTLNNRVLAERQATLDELRRTGQFIYLRKTLNDRFDMYYRRIEVVNTPGVPGQFQVKIPISLGVSGAVLDDLNAITARYTIAGNSHTIFYTPF